MTTLHLKHLCAALAATVVACSLTGQSPRRQLEAPAPERSLPRSHGAPATDRARDPRLAHLPPGAGGARRSPGIDTAAAHEPAVQAGLILFETAFHRSRGLGSPEMNADSCRACHQDPVIGGAGGLELNVSRMGDDSFGTQPFQNITGGQMLSKLRPPYVAGREEHDPFVATVFEQRQTPSILGAGRVDAIPDAAILANEDPQDRDGNGIYGVARRLAVAGGQEIGRFGWKAQVPRLRDFIMDAMGGEMGITTPDDGRGFAMLSDGDGVLDPELSVTEVDQLDAFLHALPAPRFRVSDDGRVALGEQLFGEVGCCICHVPTLPDARGKPVPLYSNLLLHNVMPAGFRGMAEPGAGTGFYKTPPLWGVSATAPYMHDGRAATLAEAILAHDGEAAGVVQSYQALAPAEQAAVVAFLQHL